MGKTEALRFCFPPDGLKDRLPNSCLTLPVHRFAEVLREEAFSRERGSEAPAPGVPGRRRKWHPGISELRSDPGQTALLLFPSFLEKRRSPYSEINALESLLGNWQVKNSPDSGFAFKGASGTSSFAGPNAEDHPECLAENRALQQLLPPQKVRAETHIWRRPTAVSLLSSCQEGQLILKAGSLPFLTWCRNQAGASTSGASAGFRAAETTRMPKPPSSDSVDEERQVEEEAGPTLHSSACRLSTTGQKPFRELATVSPGTKCAEMGGPPRRERKRQEATELRKDQS